MARSQLRRRRNLSRDIRGRVGVELISKAIYAYFFAIQNRFIQILDVLETKRQKPKDPRHRNVLHNPRLLSKDRELTQ